MKKHAKKLLFFCLILSIIPKLQATKQHRSINILHLYKEQQELQQLINQQSYIEKLALLLQKSSEQHKKNCMLKQLMEKYKKSKKLESKL